MSVPAGSSRSPAEEALDRMEERAAGSGISDEDVATVRERLERLTEERAQEIQAIVSVLPGHPQGMTPFEYARATAERVDALEAQVERLTEERLDFVNRSNDQLARAESAEAENARLSSLLETTREGLWDFAEHGTRFDCNPTVMVHSDNEEWMRLHSWWVSRANDMDATVRRRARALLAGSSRSPGETEGYRERAIEEDFYLDPKGEWVYRWNDSRWVLRLPGDTEPDGGGAK